MSRKARFLSAITAGVLLLASCGGGGDSSSRTKNSALCYDSQEAKVAAVELALAAFNAAMGGGAPGDSISDTTVPETEDSVVETEDSVVDEAPSDTVLMESSPADGGGYRRPAVRAASSGDTTVPPAGDGGGAVLTPEQQQAQMDLEAAEAQPLCEAEGAESASEVTCTATATIDSSVSDDCADGDVRLDWGGSWTLVNTAEDGTETVLTQGTWAVEALSADNPIIIPISYGGSGSGGEDNSADDCTAIFTSTGVSWDCPNGQLFNAAIEDMSNRGVYPLVECSASGSFTVAENQQFWFNFSLGGTFFDGYNNWQEQNVAIEFTVPEDTEGVCSGSDSDGKSDSDGESDSDEIDWESLPFSGESDIQVVRYSFTVPEDLGGPVLARFESTEYFDVEINGADDFESAPCDGECPPYVGFSNWDLAPGEYFIEIEENSETVSWVSNVEINPALLSIGDLPFSYTSDGSRTEYLLGLEEDQTVTLFATAGQTCLPSEADEEGNGFADPYLTLVGNGEEEFDDNSGHSAGNCSASFIEIELDAGTYTIYVRDGDEEGGSITLSSNVKLQLAADLEWNYENQDVVNESAVEFVVPDGGAWFRANTYTNQSESYTLRNYNFEDLVDSGGCANPDGDLSTDDRNCVWTGLELFFEEGGSIEGTWAESSVLSDDGELQLLTYVNSGGSKIEYFLPAGIYQLAAWGVTPDGTDANFRLEYGFGSSIEMKEKLIDVPPLSANPSTVELPVRSANPSTVELPVSSLDQGSQIAIAVSASVEEFVCDSLCIDTLFANAGLTDGSISISAGADAVTIQKGQNRAVIPVSKGADRISAQGISADGATVVNLGSKIAQLPPDVLTAIESKTAAGTSGGGSSINWLLVAAIGFIVVAGAALAVLRKRKSA